MNDITEEILSKIEYMSVEIHLDVTHDKFINCVNQFPDIKFEERAERSTHELFLKRVK